MNFFFSFIGCRQIGLLLGPCFTILLKEMDFTLIGIHVTMHNSPGLLMAILWIILAILSFFFFYDLPLSVVSFKKQQQRFDFSFI